MENSRFFRTQSLINYGNPVDLPFVLSFTKKALRFKNTVTHWLELLLLLFLTCVRQLGSHSVSSPLDHYNLKHAQTFDRCAVYCPAWGVFSFQNFERFSLLEWNHSDHGDQIPFWLLWWTPDLMVRFMCCVLIKRPTRRTLDKSCR